MSDGNHNEIFKFTEACKVGVPVIDAEHEHLFEFMNNVIASFYDENRDNISLEEYIEVLFDPNELEFYDTTDISSLDLYNYKKNNGYC